MRRTPAALGTAIALLLSATACGADVPGPAAVEGPDPTSTLTIESSWRPGEGGVMYIEGSVSEYTLTDADGDEIDPDSDDQGKDPVYTGLEDGTYTLHAAQRPCDGNCGYLDPPTDQCEQHITVDADLTVQVAFRVAEPCRITVG